MTSDPKTWRTWPEIQAEDLTFCTRSRHATDTAHDDTHDDAPAERPAVYSLAFTAAGTPRRYLLSGIPASFWIQVQARAKREHIAVRQVILTLLEGWLTARPAKRAGRALRRPAPAVKTEQPRLPLGYR